jgi:hypothetical protein
MQVIDPVVSTRKFEDALQIFRNGERLQRSRGIFLMQAYFPDMIFLFAVPHLRPQPILFAVRINFYNYDLEPLSVRFVDPLTWEDLLLSPVPLCRKINHPDRQPEFPALVQKEPNGLPFICVPGIREYHTHPAHTDDPWLGHRNVAGEGTLGFILDKLFEYGISPVANYQVQWQSPIMTINYDMNLIPT